MKGMGDQPKRLGRTMRRKKRLQNSKTRVRHVDESSMAKHIRWGNWEGDFHMLTGTLHADYKSSLWGPKPWQKSTRGNFMVPRKEQVV